MKYTFEILGISPVLDFFSHQQTFIKETYQQASNTWELINAHSMLSLNPSRLFLRKGVGKWIGLWIR
jgi:hypothetical protein